MTGDDTGDAKKPDNGSSREPFLSRFNRLKSEARHPASEAGSAAATAEREEAEPLTDADMPPVESLGPESDFTGFLSPGVSEDLRRLALRKLFHAPQFNVVDGLDDYDEDFTQFTALGSIITADMRHAMETEAKRRAEELERLVMDEETDSGEPEAVSSSGNGAPEQKMTALDPDQTGTAEDDDDEVNNG